MYPRSCCENTTLENMEVYSDSKWRCAGHSSTRIEGQSDVENGSQGRGGEDGRIIEDGMMTAHHISALLWRV